MLQKVIIESLIDLREIKNEREPKKNSFMLRDDIWKKGILILKSGRYLTDDIIEKLLNFGVYEVNVHINKDDYTEFSSQLKQKEFVKNQNIFIIENELKYINSLTKILSEIFNAKNIYGITVSKTDK